MLKLQNILSTPLAIERNYAQSFAPQLNAVFQGKELTYEQQKALREELKKNTEPLFSSEVQGSSVVVFRNAESVEDAPANSIALIRINGFISQEGNWCMKGLNDYAREIKAAGRNKNIKGVILQVNSGGGSIAGVDSFSNMVGNFERDYEKPLAVFVEGMAASAAYFISCKAPRIFAQDEMSQVGSIGTFLTMTDWSEYMKNMGIREEDIYATKSVNKNAAYRNFLKGDNSTAIEMLDKLTEVFLRAVEQGRATKLNTQTVVTTEDLQGNPISFPEALSGKVYIGSESIGAGLIDEIGTIDAVVDYIDSRAAMMGLGSSSSTLVETDIEDDDKGNNDDDYYYTNKLTNVTMFKQLSNEVLHSQVEATKTALNTIATEKGVSSSEYRQKQAEADALQAEVDFRNLQAANADLQAKNTELVKANQETTESLTAKDSEIQLLSKQVQELQAQVKASQSVDIEAINATNAELQAKVSELEASKVEIESQLQQANEAKAQSDAKLNAYVQFIEDNYDEVPVLPETKASSSDQPEAFEIVPEMSEAEKMKRIIAQANANPFTFK